MARTAVLTLVVSAFLTGDVLAAEAQRKVVEKTVALAPDGRLAVETYKGRVTVTGWDRDEAAIRAVVSPDGSCDDAAGLVAKTRVRIEGSGREVRVVSDYDDLPKVRFDFRGDCASRPFVKYDIRIPRGASLDVKDHKSRISVDGVSGNVAVESYKGVVRLSHLSGKLDLETYKGDAVAEIDRADGEVRVETYKGEIELVLPKGARVDLEEKIGRRGILETDVEDAPSGPRFSVETYKGTIRLRTK
jgi:hypothetical protein